MSEMSEKIKRDAQVASLFPSFHKLGGPDYYIWTVNKSYIVSRLYCENNIWHLDDRLYMDSGPYREVAQSYNLKDLIPHYVALKLELGL